MSKPIPRPKGRFLCQADVEAEFGVPARDVLAYVAKGIFPAPIRILGRKRWFDRAEVERFFTRRAARGLG